MTTWAAIHDQRHQQLKANTRSSTKIFFAEIRNGVFVCLQPTNTPCDGLKLTHTQSC